MKPETNCCHMRCHPTLKYTERSKPYLIGMLVYIDCKTCTKHSRKKINEHETIKNRNSAFIPYCIYENNTCTHTLFVQVMR